MGVKAEIVAVGSELLLGDVLDSNSHWLCGQLTGLGAIVRHVCQVPDEVRAIVEARGEGTFEGLRDLDGFSHVVLLYHFHRSRGFDLRVVPFLDTVERGLFATRAPRRPNPIGLTVVRLLAVEELFRQRKLSAGQQELLELSESEFRTHAHERGLYLSLRANAAFYEGNYKAALDDGLQAARILADFPLNRRYGRSLLILAKSYAAVGDLFGWLMVLGAMFLVARRVLSAVRARRQDARS